MHAHPFQLGTVGIASTHRTHGDDLLAIDTDEKLATALEIGLANRVEIIVPRTTSAMCARMLERQVVQMSDRLTVLVSISAENHSFIVAAREPRQYVVARSFYCQRVVAVGFRIRRSLGRKTDRDVAEVRLVDRLLHAASEEPLTQSVGV